jgi:hypothetical protein
MGHPPAVYDRLRSAQKARVRCCRDLLRRLQFPGFYVATGIYRALAHQFEPRLAEHCEDKWIAGSNI